MYVPAAWKKDETLADVINQMAKNNIRFVRYSYRKKGGLFDQNPLRKGRGQVPRKKWLDVENYGGYQNSSISYFLLAKFTEKKKSIVSLVPVELRFASGIKTIEDKERVCAKYAEEKHLAFEKVLLGGRIIKINTLFEIDGFRANLSCKTSDSIELKKGMPLILPPDFEQYVKKIASYCEKCPDPENPPDITKYDKITAEQNIELYDILLEKLTGTSYKVLMSNSAEILRKNRDTFVGLTVEEQTLALKQIVGLFGCNVSLSDLSAVKGPRFRGAYKAIGFSYHN